MRMLSQPAPSKIESLLRNKVIKLPVEYQKDLMNALYDKRDKRLIGNIWSLKWSGQDAYII